jgi:hypothetical protein
MLIKLEATRIPGLRALMEERNLPDLDSAANSAIGDFLERVGMVAKEEKKERADAHTRSTAQPEKASHPAVNMDGKSPAYVKAYNQATNHDAKPTQTTATTATTTARSGDYEKGQRVAQILNAQSEDLRRKLSRQLPGEG